MTGTKHRISASFSLIGQPLFRQRLLEWSRKFEVSCILDHNRYEGYPYHDKELIMAAGVQSELIREEEAGAFGHLKDFHDETNDWLFGYLTYDLKNDIENLASSNFDGIRFPAIHFFQPRYLITLHGNRVTIGVASGDPEDIFRDIISYPAFETPQTIAAHTLRPRIPRASYEAAVRAIRRHIRRGDIYEMNFCQEFYEENSELDPYDFYARLGAIAKAPFSAFYRLRHHYLMCASPERFLRKVRNKLISQPIKGTIRRGKTREEDLELRRQLSVSAKDQTENVMIVDLVRNDLSRSCIAGTVKVEELFGIYSFEQVHQLISTVSGELRPAVHFTDAIRNAFPMGSMTGAPKVRSMQLIEQYEATKRGIYSGAVGYITPDGDFDLNVVIRSVAYNIREKYLSTQVGGAIIYDSDPAAEYEECLAKVRGILKILGVDEAGLG